MAHSNLRRGGGTPYETNMPSLSALHTSKVHRMTLHQKLESITSQEDRVRGQTAGVSVRVNARLADTGKRGLVTQNAAVRDKRYYSGQHFTELDTASRLKKSA